MVEKKEYSCYYCHNNRANAVENVSTALFTAVMVLLMVCLKRASVLLFVVEQWRAWVFLVLNIVLLAIFFTSSQSDLKSRNNDLIGEMKKKRPGNCNEVEASNKRVSCGCELGVEIKVEKDQQLIEEAVVEPAAPKLSKEELNERVEAFIAMFRQHLASDARKGRAKFYVDTRQADMKHINLSSDGVNCFALKVRG